MTCALCETDGGTLVWRGDQLRLIRADDEDDGVYRSQAGWDGEFSTVVIDCAREDEDRALMCVCVGRERKRGRLPFGFDFGFLSGPLPIARSSSDRQGAPR